RGWGRPGGEGGDAARGAVTAGGLMRLLVIGASGFLGRHVWRQATAAGAAVVTAGRAALPGSPEHRQVDLATGDPAAIAEMIASVAPDAIANCAGATTRRPDVLAPGNLTRPHAPVPAR